MFLLVACSNTPILLRNADFSLRIVLKAQCATLILLTDETYFMFIQKIGFTGSNLCLKNILQFTLWFLTRGEAVIDKRKAVAGWRRCCRWLKEMQCCREETSLLARGDAVADKKRRSCWQEETMLLARGDALLLRGDIVAGKRRCSC